MSGGADRGIVIGGSGQGEALAANKVRGARAALCHDETTARLARFHNDANVLSMGARIVGVDRALAIVDVFLTTGFEGGRHVERLAEITAIEDEERARWRSLESHPGPTGCEDHGMRVRRTFAFLDLSGFTALTESEGDEYAVAVLAVFRAALRDICSRRAVRIAKWLGDGAMLVSVETQPVVAAALETKAALDAAPETVTVKCGVTTGTVILPRATTTWATPSTWPPACVTSQWARRCWRCRRWCPSCRRGPPWSPPTP